MPSGAGVILTRASSDNAELAAALRVRGIDVIELPCLRVEHLDNPAPLAAAIRALGPDDRLVFTSRAGVDAARRCVDASEVRAPVAAVGPATARRCAQWGLSAWTPTTATGAALGREMALGGGIVLLTRGDRAHDAIQRELGARGAAVHEIKAYRVVVGTSGAVDNARRSALAGAAVVVASPGAVEGLVRAIGREALCRARVLAIGPTTARAVRRAGGVEPRVIRQLTADEVARCLEVSECR